MRLSDYILGNIEAILREWERFARSVEAPAQDLSSKGLRNHAQQILKAVALDMCEPQTQQQQIEKSQGLKAGDEQQSAAQTHAVLRLVEGFSMDQMVSEYRALRSSVLRLWLSQESGDPSHQINDSIRFNEAIDQALAESIASYGQAVEATRKSVLAVLGHDLRTPLTAIVMGADLLRRKQGLGEREKIIASQIAISARHANQMVNDLLDLARCNLGIGLSVMKEITELNLICTSIVNELSAGFPEERIIFTDTEHVIGHFDPARISQVFSNLISNAVRHGDPAQPIQVSLKGDDTSVIFSVQNYGAPIPQNIKPFLFNPEGRLSAYSGDKVEVSEGLGLGLFIVSEIVAAHKGKIEVESTMARGTIFKVVIPLHP